MNSQIQTYTGKWFDVVKPDPDAVDIEDIAHALSNLCRFGGHCSRFYSVAEHSLLVAGAMEDDGHDHEACLDGLLHDAAEAYLCDVPRPIKPQLAGYKEMEAHIHLAISRKFGLVHSDHVREYDNRILADEKKELMCHRRELPWSTDGLKPLRVEIVGFSPTAARRMFIDQFHWLMEHRKKATP